MFTVTAFLVCFLQIPQLLNSTQLS